MPTKRLKNRHAWTSENISRKVIIKRNAGGARAQFLYASVAFLSAPLRETAVLLIRTIARRPLCVSTLIIFSLICIIPTHAAQRRARIAVLDFAETESGRRAADHVASSLTTATTTPTTPTDSKLSVVDRDLSRAAARGVGYRGSLNLSLVEARDIGAAIGCDFFVVGDAQTIRRSRSDAPVYYESYASIFIVSARAGRLVMWDRPSVEAATPEQAATTLLNELQTRTRTLYHAAILKADDDERQQRAQQQHQPTPDADDLLDLSADDAAVLTDAVRPPQPFRRLRPPYPDTAARAEAEATVDVTVEIDAAGEPVRIEVVRWAGFGLDEAVVGTVRRLRFRPAMRDGAPVPARILLRYNFRRPANPN